MSVYTFINGQKKYFYQSKLAPSFYYIGRSQDNTHTTNQIHVIDKETMAVKKIITLPYNIRSVNAGMYYHPKTKRLLVIGSNNDLNTYYVYVINCISNTIINQTSISGVSTCANDFNNQSGLGIAGVNMAAEGATGVKKILLINLNNNQIYQLTTNSFTSYNFGATITTDSTNTPAILSSHTTSDSYPTDYHYSYCYLNNVTGDKNISLTKFCSINGWTSSAMFNMGNDYVRSPKYSQLRTFRTGTASTVNAFSVIGVNKYKTININTTYIGNRPCGYLASGGFYFPYGQTEAAKNGANFYYYNTLTDTGSTVAHGLGSLNTNSFGISCGLRIDSPEASNTFDFFLYYGGASTSATTLRLMCTGNVTKSFTVPQYYSTAWQGLPTSDNKSIYYQNRVDNYVTNSGVIVGVSLANSSSNPVVTQYKIPQECINLGAHSNFAVSWD